MEAALFQIQTLKLGSFRHPSWRIKPAEFDAELLKNTWPEIYELR